MEGAFYFNDSVSLKDWLIRLSAETLISLSLNGIGFPRRLSPHLSSWPKMPNLRSFELHGIIDLSYFRAFPCGGLRQLSVSSEIDLDDDAPERCCSQQDMALRFSITVATSSFLLRTRSQKDPVRPPEPKTRHSHFLFKSLISSIVLRDGVL
jgi:hypothetical protein